MADSAARSEMMARPRQPLLTGQSGVVGGGLVDQLPCTYCVVLELWPHQGVKLCHVPFGFPKITKQIIWDR